MRYKAYLEKRQFPPPLQERSLKCLFIDTILQFGRGPEIEIVSKLITKSKIDQLTPGARVDTGDIRGILYFDKSSKGGIAVYTSYMFQFLILHRLKSCIIY